MDIISNKDELIFRKDFKGKPTYSMGLYKSDKESNLVCGYIKVNFRKGIDIPNKTKIKIKDAWLDFYNKDKKTYPYIFINEFEIVDNGEKENPYEQFGNSIKTESQIGKQIEIQDSDLPF